MLFTYQLQKEKNRKKNKGGKQKDKYCYLPEPLSACDSDGSSPAPLCIINPGQCICI